MVTETKAVTFELPDGGVLLKDVERSFIEQALRRTSGNQSQAARLLGITRYALRYRMEKYAMLKSSSKSAQAVSARRGRTHDERAQ